jgi:hypothetical protein
VTEASVEWKCVSPERAALWTSLLIKSVRPLPGFTSDEYLACWRDNEVTGRKRTAVYNSLRDILRIIGHVARFISRKRLGKIRDDALFTNLHYSIFFIHHSPDFTTDTWKSTYVCEGHFHSSWSNITLSMIFAQWNYLHGVVDWCCSSYVHGSGSGWKEVLRDDDTCLSQWGPSQEQTTPCDWNQHHCNGLGWARSGSFFFPAARTGTRRHFPSGEISSLSRSLVPVLQILWKCEINLQVETVSRARLLCTGIWCLRSSGPLRS